MRPVRIAVVGAGVMGRNHARVLSQTPETLLAAVVDAAPQAAETVARMHGTHARALHEVLSDDSIEGVVVATPTATHVEIAQRALDAGKHVLVEKPVAPTAQQATDLAARAAKAGRVLAAGHIERHNPAVGYVKAALDRGSYGQLIHIAARRVSRLPGRIHDVGCILDLGIHDIDAVMHIVGESPTRVHAVGGAFSQGSRFEDHAAILLGFSRGVTAVVEVNWLTPLKIRRLALTASEQYVEVDYVDQIVRESRGAFRDVNEDDLFQVPVDLSEQTVTLRRQEPLKLEALDFARAIREGARPLVSGEDAVRVLDVAEAALRSIESGDAVRLRDAVRT